MDPDPLVRKEILQTFQELGLNDPPGEVYELLLDKNLSDSVYEFLLPNKERFAKQLQEASSSQSPAIRHILKAILS